MAKKKIKFSFFVPEYDTVVSIEEIIGFYNQLPDIPMPNIIVLGGQTHGSIVVNPTILEAALKKIEELKSANNQKHTS